MSAASLAMCIGEALSFEFALLFLSPRIWSVQTAGSWPTSIYFGIDYLGRYSVGTCSFVPGIFFSLDAEIHVTV